MRNQVRITILISQIILNVSRSYMKKNLFASLIWLAGDFERCGVAL